MSRGFGSTCYGESFDGSTSDINFGTAPPEPAGAQTAMAACMPLSLGENNGGRIFGREPSGSSTGPRQLVAV